jgi:hypothetical protein
MLPHTPSVFEDAAFCARLGVEAVPTGGWRWFQKKPKPTPAPAPVKPKPDIIPIRVWFDEPENYMGRHYKQFVWFSLADKGYEASDPDFIMLSAEIQIGNVIHSVFYPETMMSYRLAHKRPYTPLEVRSLYYAIDKELEKLYENLDTMIEAYYPENKNQKIPKVKELQDRVDAAAARRDFFEAIRLALTRVPDGEYLKDKDGNSLRDDKGKLVYKPSFTAWWIVQAGKAAALEATKKRLLDYLRVEK